MYHYFSTKLKVNTPIGMDTFRQRVYWDTINKKHYYPIYEEFGIKKRARITNDLYFEILDNLIETWIVNINGTVF